MLVIENDKISIRTMQWKDINWARKIRNNPETRKWLGSNREISFLEQVKWFWGLRRSSSSKRFIITKRDTGTPVGIVRIDQDDKINKSVCIGMDIDPLWRGMKLAQQAYQLLFEYYFNRGYCWEWKNRLWLLVTADNFRAIHIYEKLGLKHEGSQRQAISRDREFVDYLLMGILRSEYEDLYR